MKRIVFIFLLGFMSACGISQVTNKDIEIRKTVPALKLNGTGAVINFYNGDLLMERSSNKLTITGGDLQVPNLIIPGSTSGQTKFQAPATGSNTVQTMPSVTGTILNTAGAEILSDLVPLLTDTTEYGTFPVGMGFPADSTLFAKGEDDFGAIKVKSDTAAILSIDLLRISAGDSCKFNFYVGNYKTGVATDSLFTAPQACGEDQTSFTPNKLTKIPPATDLWMGLKADQPTGFRPKVLVLQVNRYRIPKY